MECFLGPSRHCARPSYVKSWPLSAASILSKPVSAISLPHRGCPGGVQTSQPGSEAPGPRIFHDANIPGTCFIFCSFQSGAGGWGWGLSTLQPRRTSLARASLTGRGRRVSANNLGSVSSSATSDKALNLSDPRCSSPGECKSCGHGQRSAGEPQLQKGRQEGL